jgi:hypothetical protein
MLRKWLSALADSERIQADYPEFAQPFEESIHANRLKGIGWGDTGAVCGADVRMMDGILVLPDGRGALGAVSIGGNVRGLHAGLPDGSTIRPDVLLLDDPQDKATAESAPQTRATVEKIEADLFSISGPDTRLAIMAAVTVIAKGDVAEHFLDNPDFEALRVGQITAWPDGFSEKKSETRKRWEEWNRVRVEGIADHDEGKAARKFYRDHKKELTAGMAVSWAARYDRRRGDPDARYAAMLDYYRIGEAAFMSERQNKPTEAKQVSVYNLHPALVASRVHAGRRQCDVPTEGRVITAATDLNHYGLHSACIGFGNDQTGWVAWYGRFDNEGRGVVEFGIPEAEAKRQMFEALVGHGEQIAALPLLRDGQAVRPSLWLIDGGYMPDVVRRYIEGPGRTVGLQIIMARGYAADKYRPSPRNVIGQAREGCHLTESPVAGRFLAFNADHWREVGQKAWLATPNAPGSLSLFEGRHVEFAEQVTRERLMEKLQGQYGPVWRWHVQPGWHDYGDAVTMCYVGAAWGGGIGTTGAEAPKPKVAARALIYRPSEHGGRRW